MRRPGRLRGALQVAVAAHEGSLVNCHGCGGARGGQQSGDHEQRLQEQPSRMVRSSLRRSAPREDETQLTNRSPGASPENIAKLLKRPRLDTGFR
jgi:hypothetical protein